MSHIAAATFDDADAATEAVAALKRIGYGEGDIDAFAVDDDGRASPGTALPASVPDADAADAREGDRGALRGAAIGSAVGFAAGALALPFIGPLGVAGGVAAGAYAGALAGALNVLDDGARLLRPHRAGVVVAVHVEGRGDEHEVVSTLDASGARTIEHADGVWRQGAWADFDGVAGEPPRELRAAA